MFVKGLLKKSTLEMRETYLDVVDLRRLHDDMRANNVNDRSFHCVDKSYFESGFHLNDDNGPA